MLVEGMFDLEICWTELINASLREQEDMRPFLLVLGSGREIVCCSLQIVMVRPGRPGFKAL